MTPKERKEEGAKEGQARWRRSCRLRDANSWAGSPPSSPISTTTAIVPLANGVQGVDMVRSRRFGAASCVDLEITVDGALSLREAHEISERVRSAAAEERPCARNVTVHVNPAQTLDAKTLLMSGKRPLGRSPSSCTLSRFAMDRTRPERQFRGVEQQGRKGERPFERMEGSGGDRRLRIAEIPAQIGAVQGRETDEGQHCDRADGGKDAAKDPAPRNLLTAELEVAASNAR